MNTLKISDIMAIDLKTDPNPWPKNTEQGNKILKFLFKLNLVKLN